MRGWNLALALFGVLVIVDTALTPGAQILQGMAGGVIAGYFGFAFLDGRPY